MARIYAITGSASGIGHAARLELEAAGDHVIGVDLVEAEVVSDLTNSPGRAAAVAGVEANSGGTLHGLIACAGGNSGDAVKDVQLNYFGAVAVLEGLRPLLARTPDSRAVAITSLSVLHSQDPALVDACLSMNEEAALQLAVEAADAYAAAKRALARWVRRSACGKAWAGAGIPLNALGPGVITSPRIREVLATDEGRDRLSRRVPMPLGGPGAPEHVARLATWLVSAVNERVTGQVIFVDGGADVVLRGDDIW